MKIIYHHRTRSTDAQRIHIQEIIRAFETLGHQVKVVSLVALDTGQDNAQRDAGEAFWKRIARKIPFAYEIAQLGYNLVGIPMLVWHVLGRKVDFLYERYALFNFSGAIVARLFRIPLILEVNSPFALEQSRDREIRLLRFAGWTEKLICDMASHVIVVSTPLARLMQAAGVPQEKLEVMSNGVCLEDFQPAAAQPELRARLGLDGCIVIGFVGWFRKWHGLELLLEAFYRSGLAAGRVKVLLIGDGPAMPDLRRFVDAHHLQDSVVFTGPLPHAEVPPYLDLIDIAVQPAANEYCCPMKILEYMALGKSIVAPRQENILELLREGEEAQYFDPQDADGLAEALARLACNPTRAAEIGRQARKAVERRGLLWTSNAQRVIALVKDQQ
jgi:glycosyltransferase involved in cell wall biosynthesis